MAQMTGIQAIFSAIHEEMLRDQKVFMMGQDLKSGLYGISETFLQEVGEDRILDTPLSETAFFGAAVGAAAAGMRPIVHTVASFAWVAMDQIVSQAAKMRYMFGGQVKLPIVYRYGMLWGIRIAAHHSDRPYPMFMNMPGLKIVLPGSAADAKGLMKTAIREDDPVIFFEDRALLYGAKEEMPEGEYTIPFGVGVVRREGTDVTVVSLGGMISRVISAANKLEKENISVEVIDPRTLVPLDKEIILRSVAKTGRLVIVDVAHLTCSAASEIAAMVSDAGFWSLKSPIKRVATHNVHIPCTPVLEDLVYPTEEKIIKAIKATLE
jgi:pyruvate dehydrogenase E1 component beta subunit